MSDKPNIRQIAKAAGVSVATVSGVLNSSGRHSPATAAKVRRVMREMGYVPRRNKLRKKAPRGKNALRQVGLLFPDVNEEGARTRLGLGLREGLERVLSEQNIQLHVYNLTPDGHLPEEIRKGKMDGLVVRSGGKHQDQVTRVLSETGVPIVWAFGSNSLSSVDAVMVDNQGCGVWAANQVDVTTPAPVYIVTPSVNRNVSLEYRAISFEYHLLNRGFPSGSIQRKNPRTLSRVLETCDATAPFICYVAGNDAEVREVRDLLRSFPQAELIATMTEEEPLALGRGRSAKVLHIDPVGIGMAAAQQIILRIQTPWVEPLRLLVPAKELQKGS